MTMPVQQPGTYFWILTVQGPHQVHTAFSTVTVAPGQTRQTVFDEIHKIVAREIGIDRPPVLFFSLEPNQL